MYREASHLTLLFTKLIIHNSQLQKIRPAFTKRISTNNRITKSLNQLALLNNPTAESVTVTSLRSPALTTTVTS